MQASTAQHKCPQTKNKRTKNGNMGWGQAEEHYKSATFLTLSWDYFKVFLGKKKTKVKPGDTECKNKIKSDRGKKEKKHKCYS